VPAKYSSLRMPVVIIAGEQDRLIDIDAQSSRLHREVKQSKFRRVANAGHMVHQSATALVTAAIDEAEERPDNDRGKSRRSSRGCLDIRYRDRGLRSKLPLSCALASKRSQFFPELAVQMPCAHA